jgi:NADH-quinone oxidoreductase subunit I
MFKYLKDIIKGIISLCEGLWVTLKHVFRGPSTLQYPEEKPDLAMRFRGRLVMPIDPEKNDHRCTACMLCVKACPNRSIELIEKVAGEDGKPKPKASKYIYNLGTCMFCNLCVEACNFGAIVMSDEYENASQDKNDFIIDLVAEKYKISGKKEKWWIGKLKDSD